MCNGSFGSKRANVRFSSHLRIIFDRNLSKGSFPNIYLECKEDLT